MCIATFKDNSHQAKLANCGTPGIWVGYTENYPAGTNQIFNPRTKKIILTQYVTFLQKSYGEYTKVEKPVTLTMHYEGLDEGGGNNNNHINIVRDSNSNSSEEDVENNKENFFDEDIDNQVNISSPNHCQCKSGSSCEKAQSFV